MALAMQVVVVLSGSMEPAFYRGDILFLYMGKKPFSAGEVVVFNINGRDIPIVHRIIKVHEKIPGSKKDEDVLILTKVGCSHTASFLGVVLCGLQAASCALLAPSRNSDFPAQHARKLDGTTAIANEDFWNKYKGASCASKQRGLCWCREPCAVSQKCRGSLKIEGSWCAGGQQLGG